jgi:cytochrome P450
MLADPATTLIYDPFSAEMHEDPFPTYERLRKEAPLYRNAERDFWALSRYDDVQAVSRDWRTFSYAEGNDIDGQGEMFDQAGNFLDADPPKHTQLRRVVQGKFTPKDIAKLEPLVRERTNQIVDGFLERGTADLAADLAWLLPVATACGLLGLPREDEPLLARSAKMVSIREAGNTHVPEAAARAHHDLEAYLRDFIQSGHYRSSDGLMRHIVESQVGGTPISEAAALGISLLLFVGAVETTASSLSSAFMLLGQHPEQRALLAKDASRIPAAFEEVLRHQSPIQVFCRKTTRPVELHGEPIPEASNVFIIYGSANRDEARFEDGARFDVRRVPRRHLAFGEGIHHCIGAPLARLEGKVALETVLARLPRYELSEQSVRLPSHGVRGLLKLPITV